MVLRQFATSRPPAADRAACRASAGLASMKWNVVLLAISESRGR